MIKANHKTGRRRCRRLPYFCRGLPVVANVFDRFRSLVLSVFMIVALAVPAFAGAFDDAVAKFANDEFSDTEEAIGAVATSGNPLAFPIISALQAGRLSAEPLHPSSTCQPPPVRVAGRQGNLPCCAGTEKFLPVYETP